MATDTGDRFATGAETEAFGIETAFDLALERCLFL
jgi:hypothetical protein